MEWKKWPVSIDRMKFGNHGVVIYSPEEEEEEDKTNENHQRS